MGRNFIKVLFLAACFCCLTSCMIEIREQFPRWKVSLKYNGVSDSFECVDDTYPASMEYSVPEFFILDDGDKVVFRFYYKDMGLKLQAASEGPFRYGKKYSLRSGDEFFDVSFDWLYNGRKYECQSGWMEFKRAMTIREAYSVSFEFDLAAPGEEPLSIRNGVFTVYDKVAPRNTGAGLQ